MPLSALPELSSGVLLCIDDNQDVLECEKAFLEDFGYTVLTALSGGKGLEVASMYSVDVVIVDYCMPEMNGQELPSLCDGVGREHRSSCSPECWMCPTKFLRL